MAPSHTSTRWSMASRNAGISASDGLWRAGRRDQQILLVPDEVLVAVDGQLVVLAHEDGGHGARLLAIAAEDAARLVNLIDGRVAGPRHDGAVILGSLEVNRVGRAGDGAQPARHALLEAVLVPHEHLLAPVLRKHRDLFIRVVHRDGLPEHVLEGQGEPGEKRANLHGAIITKRSSRAPSILDGSMPHGGPTTTRDLLLILMAEVAGAAILATMLVRFHRFRRILLSERRDWPERLIFAAGLGVPLTAGVIARLLLSYDAADLTLPGSFLAGLIAGPYAGAIVGAAVGIPAFVGHEYAALPFAIGCGFAGGGLREVCPKDQIWRFSPFFVTKLKNSAWRLIRNLQLDWQVILVMAPVALELLRQRIGEHYPHRIFFFAYVSPMPWWLLLLVITATVLSVAIPIKIWNSARIEHRLAEQEKLLMTARVEALANQINPHFLFNTLTSISSLIRSQPETARMLIVKLSGLLRRLLRSQEHFVTLREEIEAVDEYLDIERVRFGPNLVVEKVLDDASLGLIVPSMILQPLIENSIKH